MSMYGMAECEQARIGKSARREGVYVGVYKKMDRVTVDEAAARLGVKEQAVRKRIQRGTIAHDKDEDGRVYVYLDPYEDTGNGTSGTRTDTSTDKSIDTSMHKLVDSLEDQVSYLKAEVEAWREEARRK